MVELEYRKLNKEEIESALAELPGWEIENEQLVRSYEFRHYVEGAKFVAGIVEAAESLNHHPDVFLGYCRVRVAISTHDVEGISPYDFHLALKIDSITLD